MNNHECSKHSFSCKGKEVFFLKALSMVCVHIYGCGSYSSEQANGIKVEDLSD